MRIRKSFLILILSFMVIGLQAQFSKPLTTRVEQKLDKQIVLEKVSEGTYKATPTLPDSSVFLVSADVSFTGLFIPFNTKSVQGLNSLGYGVSYGNYSIIKGKAWCNYAINGNFITQYTLDGLKINGLGGSLTVSVLNKFVGLGIAYIGTDGGFKNGTFGALARFSYSF
jgi:hypothetical protein